MPDLRKIIEEKNKRLVSVPNKLYSSIEKSEAKIYQNLLTLLDKLKLDVKGNVIRSRANLIIADEITTELKKVLYSSDYIKAVSEFSKQFNVQKIENDQYFNKAFPLFEGSALADDLVVYSRRQAVTLLTGSSVDVNFFQPINKIIIDSVDTGASRIDLIKAIQDTVIGDPEKEGKLLSYSKQIAHDAFALADRSYTNAIAEELNIEWYFYSGGIIDTSRDFCIERHEKYFYYKEIQDWASLKWDGKMKGTNKATIFKTAGGYNCEHSITPVSISVVPDSVIKRNKENGNIKK